MDRREALQRAALVLGYAISAPVMVGVLNGCKATPDAGFQPAFLDPAQAALISELAEIIIPKTDTPGAKDAGVPAFIDLMLKDCYPAEEQKRFLTELGAFDAAAKAAYGSEFVSCSEDQKKEYVTKVHQEALAAVRSENPPKDRAFILMVKELTLLGFFTSEPGATQVLSYVSVPGSYQGCVPMGSVVKDSGGTEYTVGKTWAT